MPGEHPYRKEAPPVHAPTPLPPESRLRVNELPGYLSVQWTTTREPSDDNRQRVLYLCVGLALILLALLSWSPSSPSAFVFWLVGLAGWNVGAVHALVAFSKSLRAPGPERIVLRDTHLRYVPSRVWNWDYVRRRFGGAPPHVRIPWHELPSLRLQPTPGRQRLILDRGTYWVEVGKILTDAERAWLADTIGTWADSHGYR